MDRDIGGFIGGIKIGNDFVFVLFVDGEDFIGVFGGDIIYVVGFVREI